MDAVVGELEPESMMDNPANLTKSSSLRIILLVPTMYCEDVTYWVDMDIAVNNPLTVNDPETY